MDSEEEFDEYIEDLLRRRVRTPRRIVRDFENPLQYYNEQEFKRRFRFRKETVLDVLLPLVLDGLKKQTTRGLPILPVYQLLIALRFYASGSFQIVSADLIKVSQASISRIIKNVSRLICYKVKDYIKLPTDTAKINQEFYAIANFPGVIACIDGTHIPIQSPGGLHAEVYRNRKRFFSLNVQIACGPSLEIFDIVANRPGSVHDNRIFDHSVLKTRFESGSVQGLLLGDSGYGCKTYLLTPVLQPNDQAEERYNRSHIKTRNTVERAIGVWKRIFPCLSKKMATNLTTTSNIVVATAILYNICRSRHEQDDIFDEFQNGRVVADISNHHLTNNQGLLFRRMFIARHFS